MRSGRARQELAESLQKVSTAAYQAGEPGPAAADGAGPEAGDGQAPEGEPAGESEEAVEGEFKEV